MAEIWNVNVCIIVYVHLNGSRVLSGRDWDQPGDSKCIQIIPLLRTHHKISPFDLSSFIIILFGKHNVIRSQKNYRIALQKTNNLLALCLSEQRCLPASSHPFHCSHYSSQHSNMHTHTLFVQAPYAHNTYITDLYIYVEWKCNNMLSIHVYSVRWTKMCSSFKLVVLKLGAPRGIQGGQRFAFLWNKEIYHRFKQSNNQPKEFTYLFKLFYFKVVCVHYNSYPYFITHNLICWDNYKLL